uniref:Matrix remodeling-associated protein 8 n=1 Tax=Gasterosteus aculeatus aculeatus TaxID=481459 RepID=A0AAQ4PDJ7_GASAC
LFSLSVVAFVFSPGAWGLSGGSAPGVVAEPMDITLPAGSKALLPCQSPRMVWPRDRLKDRQRVVTLPAELSHRHHEPVVAADKGMYTCNLHHHYCQIHQSIQIQLNVTKSARKEKRYWDGEKSVFVVLLGKSVVLPCVNRRPLWREGLQEEQQQVAHWDFQPPGVRPDSADRLVDLYASGERRDYGPLFGQSRMSVEEDAFTLGDFSLSISSLKPADKGLYYCHLHHHYCGLHERRIFRLTVGPPLPSGPTTAPRISQNDVPELRTEEVEGPRVVNVILPDHRGYFVQHLGYFLATFLLLACIVVAVIMLTRRRKKRGALCDRNSPASLCSYLLVIMNVTLSETWILCELKNNLLKESNMAKDCDMGEQTSCSCVSVNKRPQ